jgi:hypothetical protein
VIIKEFCYNEFTFVKSLIEIDLEKLQKSSFEEALRENDIDKINLCAGLAKVLKLEGE